MDIVQLQQHLDTMEFAPTLKPSAINPVSWKLNSFTPRSCCCVPSDSVGSKMCTSHCVLWTTSCSNSAGTETELQ